MTRGIVGALAMIALAVAGGLGLGGCAGGTSVALDVSLAAGAPEPAATMFVRVFDDGGAMTSSRRLAGRNLPGVLVIYGLPDRDQRLRVVVDGGAVLGARAVDVRAGSQVREALVLSATVSDRDGDRVPDAVDVCPDDPDPDQLDGDRDAAGDACSGARPPDMAPASPDLANAPSLCATAGLTFCDGFESPTLAAHWTPTSATVVAGGARGERSVRLTIPAGTADAQLTTRMPFSTLGPDVWARAFVELPATIPDYVVLMEISDDNGTGWLLAVASGDLQLDPYTPGMNRQSSVQLPRGRFACLEWHVSTSEVRVFLDGTEVTALTITGLNQPAWRVFSLTSNLPSPATASFSTRVDEVALHSSRITCAR
jgi:hypothetical protein